MHEINGNEKQFKNKFNKWSESEPKVHRRIQTLSKEGVPAGAPRKKRRGASRGSSEKGARILPFFVDCTCTHENGKSLSPPKKKEACQILVSP